MPDLTVTLTANQAQRVSAALGVSTNAEAVNAVKAWLKAQVRDYEARVAGNTARDSAITQVNTDFSGF